MRRRSLLLSGTVGIAAIALLTFGGCSQHRYCVDVVNATDGNIEMILIAPPATGTVGEQRMVQMTCGPLGRLSYDVHTTGDGRPWTLRATRFPEEGTSGRVEALVRADSPLINAKIVNVNGRLALDATETKK